MGSRALQDSGFNKGGKRSRGQAAPASNLSRAVKAQPDAQPGPSRRHDRVPRQ